jgi:hypothetical protein
MYISRKERTAVLDAVDFIRTNTDGATDRGNEYISESA